MKILYISYNGLLSALFQSQGLPYIIGASQKGHKFFILTFDEPQSLIKSNPAYLEMAKKLSENKILWFSLRFHKHGGIFAKLYDVLQGIIVSLFLIIRFKINAVQARGLFSASIALLPGFLTRIKIIFDTRSKLSEAYMVSGRWAERGLSYRLAGLLEYICFRFSHAIIVETNFHKQELENSPRKPILKKPIEVIPCCVELERFKNAAGQKSNGSQFCIAYLGSLSGWYCLKETMSFFIKAYRLMPYVNMMFLTKDDTQPILKYMAENNIPKDLVKIYDVSPGEVAELLSRASAGIIFRYPFKRLSSFPIKIGEYLASGIPVILNKGIGEPEEFVLNNRVGVSVNGFTDSDFEDGIKRIIELTNQKDLRNRCLSAAKLLSTDKGIEKYLRLYEAMAKAK